MRLGHYSMLSASWSDLILGASRKEALTVFGLVLQAIKENHYSLFGLRFVLFTAALSLTHVLNQK